MEIKYKTKSYSYDEIINEKTFTFPVFQRGVVWPEKTKKAFIQTVINGEPFGTLLVYENKNKTYLIDGLQRVSTIREFAEDKYKLLLKDIIEDNDINLIIKEVKRIYKEHNEKTEKIKSKLEIDKMKESIFLSIKNSHADLQTVVDALKKNCKMDFASNKNMSNIQGLVGNIIKEINKKISIDKQLRVIAINYTGDESRLPDVFYNLNTGGVVPSKYEVLASLWNDTTYKVNDKEIIDEVYKRYTELQTKSKLLVTIERKDLVKNGITLFDYCYAIGKLLYSNSKPYISFIKKGNDNIEPIGFSIVALILNQKENSYKKIYDILKDAQPEFLIELKNIIFEAFDKIYEGLEFWVKSERITKGNNVNYNNNKSNYMIYHMFMSYVKKNYTIDEKQKIITHNTDGVTSWNKNFIANVHYHYFYDFLIDYWSANRQVTNLMDNIKNTEILYKYSSLIDNDKWEKALNAFKDEQLKYTAQNFSNKTKLFLEYLIKFKILQNKELKEKYFKSPKNGKDFTIDIEHIVPKDRFKEKLGEKNIKQIPAYSLGNACYLTSTFNEGKHSFTNYEYIDMRPEIKVNEEFNDFVDYPTREEIDFVKLEPIVFKSSYMDYLEKRLTNLMKEFLELKKYNNH